MSVRNNLERLGIENSRIQQSEDVQSVVEQTKTEVAYTQPTEIVDLPSKGRFYPEGHPLHNVESLEIRFMTAKDEEILNSKSLLQKGVALDKMLQGLLTRKDVKIDDLYIGDKNALIVAARITGYGNEYSANVTCLNCAQGNPHQFDLEEIRKVKEVDEEVLIESDGTFELTLPRSKAKVKLKLLNGKDEKMLSSMSEKKKKLKLPDSAMTDQLKTVIVSVNGVSDSSTVSNFVDNLLAMDSKSIREYYAKMAPNVDLKYDYECPSCMSTTKINIPFTTDFFWPGG